MVGRKPRDSERFRKAFRELGRRISEERKRRGWSQDDLAIECGMSGTGIGEIERAESFPNVESILLLAAALGVGADALVVGLEKLVPAALEFADDTDED